jgi:hypothetical protein
VLFLFQSSGFCLHLCSLNVPCWAAWLILCDCWSVFLTSFQLLKSVLCKWFCVYPDLGRRTGRIIVWPWQSPKLPLDMIKCDGGLKDPEPVTLILSHFIHTSIRWGRYIGSTQFTHTHTHSLEHSHTHTRSWAHVHCYMTSVIYKTRSQADTIWEKGRAYHQSLKKLHNQLVASVIKGADL